MNDVMKDRKEYMKQYQKTHKEKIMEISLRYREKNREVLRQRGKDYYRRKCLLKLENELGIVIK